MSVVSASSLILAYNPDMLAAHAPFNSPKSVSEACPFISAAVVSTGSKSGSKAARISESGRALVEKFDIEPYSDFLAKWSNFRGLVLFCIDAKFCKKIFVGKLLTRSTRFTCFCTAQASIFQKMFVKLFHIFRQNFAEFTHFRKIFIEFCSEFDEILSEVRKYFRKC